MKRMEIVLSVSLAAAPACAALEPPRTLAIKECGYRSSYENGRVVNTKLYNITLGDTTRQDELAWERAGSYQGPFAPFQFNAAQHFHRVDGRWWMWNWRPQGPSDAENERFKAYLNRPEVMDFLRDPYAAGDFGKPGDFIFKRARIEAPADLPPPLDRLSPESLEPILSIFQYNEDGTIKILLKDPYDEDGRVQELLERLKREIEAR